MYVEKHMLKLESVSAAIERGKRPVPFRTRKLSLSSSMVLQGGPCGRVDRRRTSFIKASTPLIHESEWEDVGAFFVASFCNWLNGLSTGMFFHTSHNESGIAWHYLEP